MYGWGFLLRVIGWFLFSIGYPVFCYLSSFFLILKSPFLLIPGCILFHLARHLRLYLPRSNTLGSHSFLCCSSIFYDGSEDIRAGWWLSRRKTEPGYERSNVMASGWAGDREALLYNNNLGGYCGYGVKNNNGQQTYAAPILE